MPFPSDVGVVDLMLQIPGEDRSAWYDFMKPLLLDEESRQIFSMPAEYLFKQIPDGPGPDDDPIAWTLAKMDAVGVDRAMIGVDDHNVLSQRALKEHPERFFASYHANPNLGMEGVRTLERMHREYGIKAVTAFPSGLCPQVPIDDARWYPIYAKCVELDLPFCCCVGVPGPRLPMDPQKVERIDPVCWFFPELKFVFRHGTEPWDALAVKLMLKWPGLYYSTSAFAPKYYPKSIIDYANTRGSDKVLYAGYFPMGLSLERIFRDMPDVLFRDEVWPKFLRGNAAKLLKLDA